ncbi:MAG: glycosyltransferase family 1 protein [Bacteroidota bacterium]|nr:glycosyltransferase family 1 protein [Bacteroidota bacterium]
MRIGYDAKRLFCNHRGLGNYSRDLIRILNQYYPENHYDLFTPKIKINVPVNAENTTVIQPDGIYKYLPSSVWRSIGVCSNIKRCGDTIFHGLSQELPWGIEKTGTKNVVTMHDAIFMRYPELYSSTYRAVFIQKNKHACRVADHIIAISEQTKRDIINFFGADEKKISVVYQGCNNIFRKQISEEQKITVRTKYNLPDQFLLNVGSIEKRKNAALIVEALHFKKLDIPLVIIGKPTLYIDEIRSLISKYKMEEQVVFIHDAETIDLPAIYSLSDMFIYPSIFEGFGIPILEALCTSTPVITSTGSCFEETGGPSSSYINPQSAEELGNAISEIMNDSLLEKKMKDDGLIFSGKFTDNNIAKELMSIYQSV